MGAVWLLALLVGALVCCGAATADPIITEFPAPIQPRAIAAGPDGALWFTTYQNDIGRITPAGAFTAYPLPPGYGAESITAGPDGALWFSEATAANPGTKIGRITTAGAYTEYPIPTYQPSAVGITSGPDGALWFTDSGNNGGGEIGRITTTGTITENPIPSGNHAGAITAGPDGALWFSEPGAGNIGRITTTGTITEYPLPNGAEPESITAGRDGALWFTQNAPGPQSVVGRITTLGAITEYPIPSGYGIGGVDNMGGIAAGSDGALWFPEATSNGGSGKIGRITTTGTITEYPIPSGNQGETIAAGPDGNLWFTEFGGWIGRVNGVGPPPGPCTLVSPLLGGSVIAISPRRGTGELISAHADENGNAPWNEGGEAVFTFPNAGNFSHRLPPASSFTATVNWGDGSPPTEVTAATGGPGTGLLEGPPNSANSVSLSGTGVGDTLYVYVGHTWHAGNAYQGGQPILIDQVYFVTTSLYFDQPSCPHVPIAAYRAFIYVFAPAASKEDKGLIARALKGIEVLVGAADCGLGLAAGETGIGAAVGVAGCVFTAKGLGELLRNDPPDSHYKRIFSARRWPMPYLPRRCLHLGGALCQRFRAADRRYLQSAAQITSLTEALAVTSNRFSSAVAAGDAASVKLQRHAEAGYFARLSVVFKQKATAARRLSAELKRDHLNTVISRQQVLRARARLSRLQGFPAQLVARLQREGVITGRADLKQTIARILRNAPPAKRTTLADVVAAG